MQGGVTPWLWRRATSSAVCDTRSRASGWLRVTVVVLPRSLGKQFAWAARAAVFAALPITDVLVFFEDDHDVTVRHLDNFLSLTACEHLPKRPSGVSFFESRRTGPAGSTVSRAGLGDGGGLPRAALPFPWEEHRSCAERVPSNWIVGMLQVSASQRGVSSRWPGSRGHATLYGRNDARDVVWLGCAVRNVIQPR